MEFKSRQSPPQARPFWLRVLLVTGADTAAVLVGALILRDLGQVSNLYFLSSIVLFVLAAVPIATEIGSNIKIVGRAARHGETAGPLLKEKQLAYERGARTTYVYGVAGLLALLLSILSIGLG